MCLYPKLIRNKKYTENKKNGGVVPTVLDERTKLVAVGCQDCIECRKQKAREWQVRLTEDIKKHKNGKFVTLTFSNESVKNIVEGKNIEGKQIRDKIELEGYKLDTQIAIVATRDFLERWRKKYGKSLRHWLVTEIGHEGTENIHMHGIVWTNEKIEEIAKIWAYGYLWPKDSKVRNYVNAQTVNYIVKYITKRDEKHTKYKSRILTSQGIGSNYTTDYIEKEEEWLHRDKEGNWTLRKYLKKVAIPKKIGDYQNNKYKENKTNETYRLTNGNKTSLPIYYRNKIYSEEEREKLWIEKLNKEERYILGMKVTEKEYHRAIKYAREKNNRLGYGKGEKDYDTKEYEEKRRKLMQMTRMMKAKKKVGDA